MNRREILKLAAVGGLSALCQFLPHREALAWYSYARANQHGGGGGAGSSYTLELDIPITKDNNASINLRDGSVGRYIAGRFSTGKAFNLKAAELYCSGITGSPTYGITAMIYTKTGTTPSTDEPNAQTGTISGAIDSAAVSALSYTPYFVWSSAVALANDSYWFVADADAYSAGNYLSFRYDSIDTGRVMHSYDASSWINVDNSGQLHIRLYS